MSQGLHSEAQKSLDTKRHVVDGNSLPVAQRCQMLPSFQEEALAKDEMTAELSHIQHFCCLTSNVK